METLDSADVELPYYSLKCESLKCESLKCQLPSRGMTWSVFARKQPWSKGNFEFWPICWEWKLMPGKEGTRRWCKRACNDWYLFLQASLAYIFLKRYRFIWIDWNDLLWLSCVLLEAERPESKNKTVALLSAIVSAITTWSNTVLRFSVYSLLDLCSGAVKQAAMERSGKIWYS